MIEPHAPETPSRFSPADDLDLKPLIQTAEAVVDEARPHLPPSVWKRLKPLWPILLLFGIGLIAFFSPLREQLSLTGLQKNYDWLAAEFQLHPYLVETLFVFGLAIVIATGLPGGALLEIAGGVLFGAALGVGLGLLGVTLGASVLFFLGRRAVLTQDGSKAPALVESIREHFAANPVSYAFFMRLVPFFPFGGATLALAWLRCSIPLFFAATMLGVLPALAVYSWLGDGLRASLAAHHPLNPQLLTEPQILWPLMGLAALGLLPVVWRAISHFWRRH